jgi:membrane associated rhomboid family serine protease
MPQQNQHRNNPHYDDPTTPYRRQIEDGIQNQTDEFEDEYNQRTQDDRARGLLGGNVRLLDVYSYRQKYGYCSILFSTVQTIVLAIMMYECGVAHFRINPMIGPYPDALSNWGAKNSASILEDREYWRLLSPLVLHAGVIHLVGNVSVQIETCLYYEKEWGSAVWLFIYIASAVGSTVASTCFLPNVLSVGSSGAVMGILGAKISEFVCRCCESRITVQQKAGHAMRYYQLAEALGGAIIVMLFSFLPFVDWAAHLGGLVTGISVGCMVFACYIENVFGKCIIFVFSLVLTVWMFVVSLTYMLESVEPAERLRDVCAYYQEFFANYECSCPRE